MPVHPLNVASWAFDAITTLLLGTKSLAFRTPTTVAASRDPRIHLMLIIWSTRYMIQLGIQNHLIRVSIIEQKKWLKWLLTPPLTREKPGQSLFLRTTNVVRTYFVY